MNETYKLNNYRPPGKVMFSEASVNGRRYLPRGGGGRSAQPQLPVLTSNVGYCIGLYASYWNAFLYLRYFFLYEHNCFTGCFIQMERARQPKNEIWNMLFKVLCCPKSCKKSHMVIAKISDHKHEMCLNLSIRL